jgi:NADPH:quinone reductase-like Zn-dependent oxidoreductase
MEDEVAMEPKNLAWNAAAAMPLSAQTHYEALYDHAGIPIPELGDNLKRETYRLSTSGNKQRVLITDAAGAVGIYLVQLASISGLYTVHVAATSSITRNQEFLKSLGADETVEYSTLLSEQSEKYNVIVDTVGGDILVKCCTIVKEGGKIITLDSQASTLSLIIRSVG